jgi:hypothetical protein
MVCWPMTNWLNMLKETELQVGFTDVFRTVGVREVLHPEVLRRRLLLALYGLGTNAGLKRMSSGGGGDSYDDLLYVRRKYITTGAPRPKISIKPKRLPHGSKPPGSHHTRPVPAAAGVRNVTHHQQALP